ncbi:MAG: primosomal protein N' [Coriobacteriales bacterium]|jgi:primosomal protein N' (replication factor Y)|nr:primosomal protein N' [Coriobacteriales bacterium]
MPRDTRDNQATNAPSEQLSLSARYAQVVLDIPTRALDSAFDYALEPPLAARAEVGCSVLVDFAHRPALGYIVGLSRESACSLDSSRIKPVRELLSTPLFEASAVELAFWIAREYLAPLSDCIRLFTPPGGTARLKKDVAGKWAMVRPQARAVDDRWVRLSDAAHDFEPPHNAHRQRAVLESLRFGEMRVQDLALSVENPAPAVQSLERRGMVIVEQRQRVRGSKAHGAHAEAIQNLTPGQRQALETVHEALSTYGEGTVAAADKGSAFRAAAFDAASSHSAEHAASRPVILLDGVTGSGKTEVYLQAISRVLEGGGSACVLVPEISLTPQTVSRFRSRFGEEVAVLHSRLSAGERFDQWELVRSGQARVVVGARSALFAPLRNLRLIVIDEEHESSYKQGSSPRYVSREVAIKRAALCGAVVVLGSATPSLESLHAAGLCGAGACDGVEQPPPFTHVILPERVSGRPLPPVEVVDLSAEFHAGNKSMYSFSLKEALRLTIERGEKAVVLLNKRGFASVLLCRDCGYVPTCEQCDTSLTFHQHPARLLCHYCDAHAPVPPVCPECGSPYLKQLGPGTQYAADQLVELLPPGTPIVRMDADTTRLKDGHEKRLEEFAAARSGVLLGTQMIAKGLDFADVTLVGVLIADLALKFPDFRAAERTWQLLEQVSGRAGRAEKDGRVIVQTYWPEHVAIRAAASHDRSLLLKQECTERAALNYPPFGRLANILVWGKNREAVQTQVAQIAETLRPHLPEGWQLLGPSPCILSKRQGSYRWHLLLKAPARADLPGWLDPLLKGSKGQTGVNRAVDIDPQDMM